MNPCQVMFCRPRGSLKLKMIITAMGANRKITTSAVKTGSAIAGDLPTILAFIPRSAAPLPTARV